MPRLQRSPRPWAWAFALALGVLVAVVSVEAAEHSVHHLLEPEENADCAIASGAGHLDGTAADTVHDGQPFALAAGSAAPAHVLLPALACPPPRQGRGPPSLA
ncbi:MAG TPA: hypothetical protein VFN71_08910 [Methylomirabilota bacterium]|nr:hypothetical protein [Methylomirabilota bacterium]